MMRLVVFAVLAVLAYRMLVGRWPWEKPPGAAERALVKARRLLGVPVNAGRADVLAAHKRRLAEVHPDRGGSGARVHEVNAARDLLLTQLPTTMNHEPEEPS